MTVTNNTVLLDERFPGSTREDILELHLQEEPQTLLDIISHFPEDPGHFTAESVIVWISKNAFLRTEKYCPKLGTSKSAGAGTFEKSYFLISTSKLSETYSQHFHLHASDEMAAVACIEFLMTLPDCHFDSVTFCDTRRSLSQCIFKSVEPPPTIISSLAMEEMFQCHPRRKHNFKYMVFNKPQCRAFFSSTGSRIGFDRCFFKDGGASFIEAYSEKSEIESTGLISFISCFPFERKYLIPFLNQPRRYEALELQSISFDGSHSVLFPSSWFLDERSLNEYCKAIVETDRAMLRLENVALAEGGASLIVAVNVQSGPRGLRFGSNPFCHGMEGWRNFFQAIESSNTYLKCLEFDLRPEFESEFFSGLAQSVLRNAGLEKLKITNLPRNIFGWRTMLHCLLEHKTLRFVLVGARDDPEDNRPFKKFAKQTRSLLEQNEQLEDIVVVGNNAMQQSNTWKRCVSIPLDLRRAKKTARRIGEIESESIQAAALGILLGRVSARPGWIWTLVSHNQDAILRAIHRRLPVE